MPKRGRGSDGGGQSKRGRGGASPYGGGGGGGGGGGAAAGYGGNPYMSGMPRDVVAAANPYGHGGGGGGGGGNPYGPGGGGGSGIRRRFGSGAQQRRGKGGRNGGGGGRNDAAKQQRRAQHESSQRAKAGLKRLRAHLASGDARLAAREASDVAQATSGAEPSGETAHKLVALLAKRGQVAEVGRVCARALGGRSGGRLLPADAAASALAGLPMLAGIAGARGGALCDAVATVLDLPGSHRPEAGEAAASFFRTRSRWATVAFLDEADAALKDVLSRPAESLARAGRCVHGCAFRPGLKEGEVVATGGSNGGGEARRGLSPGDAVAVRLSADSTPDAVLYEGEVGRAQPLCIKFGGGGKGGKGGDAASQAITRELLRPGSGPWRIDQLANRASFERAVDAVGVVASASLLPQTADAAAAAAAFSLGSSGGGGGGKKKKGRGKSDKDGAASKRFPSPFLAAAIVECAKGTKASWSDVRALCEGSVPTPSGQPLAMPRDARDPVGRDGRSRNFNPSQVAAYALATTQRLTLIQGPPGTGKTHVSVAVLAHWARTHASALAPPATGGTYGPMSTSAKGGGPAVLACSDSNIAVDNLLDGLLKDGVRAIRLGRPEGTSPHLLAHSADAIASEAARNAPPGAAAQAFLEARVRAINRADVVCCTCIGAGVAVLKTLRFSAVLVDEAAQATELSSLVPLTHGCQQLVLVGDHMQLPPTVSSDLATQEGLGESLFGRLAASGARPALLDTQYRMHPVIAEMPSACFYEGMLKSGVTAEDRPPLPGFQWPRPEVPVAFLDRPQGREEGAYGTSKSNPDEARTVIDVVRDFLRGGVPPHEIGIVSPYAAQVTLLRRLRPSRDIEVASVDGFQGREKALIVVSCVRANDSGNIGFLADWRRANVALTRAKRGLVVVGTARTLQHDQHAWGPLLRWARARGVVYGQPQGPSDDWQPPTCPPPVPVPQAPPAALHGAALEEALGSDGGGGGGATASRGAAAAPVQAWMAARPPLPGAGPPAGGVVDLTEDDNSAAPVFRPRAVARSAAGGGADGERLEAAARRAAIEKLQRAGEGGAHRAPAPAPAVDVVSRYYDCE